MRGHSRRGAWCTCTLCTLGNACMYIWEVDWTHGFYIVVCALWWYIISMLSLKLVCNQDCLYNMAFIVIAHVNYNYLSQDKGFDTFPFYFGRRVQWRSLKIGWKMDTYVIDTLQSNFLFEAFMFSAEVEMMWSRRKKNNIISTTTTKVATALLIP